MLVKVLIILMLIIPLFLACGNHEKVTEFEMDEEYDSDTSFVTGSSFKRGVMINSKNKLTPEMSEILKPDIVRLNIKWLRFEPHPGEFDYNYLTELFSALSEDIEILLHIECRRGWMTGHPEITGWSRGDFPPNDTNVFKRSMRFLVQQCCGRVKYFQIFNEPNVLQMYDDTLRHWNGTVNELIYFTNIFYEIVRDECPDAGFVLCGLAAMEIDKWAEILMACKFDYWDLHKPGLNKLEFFVNKLWDYDRSKGFVVSETAVPDRHNNYESFEEINEIKADEVNLLIKTLANLGVEFATWNVLKYNAIKHPCKYWALFDENGNPYEAAYIFGATADSTY